MESLRRPTPFGAQRFRGWFTQVLAYLGLRTVRPILGILVVGLAIRFFFLPLTDHPFDVYQWYLAGQRIYSGQGLYSPIGPGFDYPPIWGGFIGVTDGLYNLLSPLVGANPMPESQAQALLGTGNDLGAPVVLSWLFVTLVKIPIILFDTLLTFLIYRVSTQRLGFSPNQGRFAAGAFFLNPVVILTSSVWGQFDAIATYFLLLGILLFFDHHPVYSGLLFGLAAATKYFPVVVLLVIVIALYSAHRRTDILRTVAVFVTTVLVISLPFLVASGASFVGGILTPSVPRVQTEDSGWGVASYFLKVALPPWMSAATLVGAFALLILLGLAFRAVWRGQPSRDGWIDLAILSILAFYAVYETLNDQYFVWVMPFLAFDLVRHRSTWPTYSVLSILVIVHAVLSLAGTSFFLPALTVSSQLKTIVVLTPSNSVTAAYAVAAAVYAVVIVLFAQHLLRLSRSPRRGRDWTASPSPT